MDRKELFENFYNELYKDILDEYYLDIANIIKKNKLILIISIIIFTALPTLFVWILFFKKKYIFFLFIVSLFYDLATIIFFRNSYRENKKEIIKQIKYKILDDIITLISNDQDHQVLPGNRISKASFEKASIFNFNNVKYTGSNYIQVNFNNKNIVLADMEIYTYTEKIKSEYFYIGSRKFLRTYKDKKKKEIFSGCYIGSELDKKSTNLIQIIPNSLKNNIINKKVNNYYDLCSYEIKLENLEFSKRYSVYSNDEIKARMTLTLSMLEKINELENIIKNKKYIIFKNDGRYAIFIENYTIEKILNDNLDNRDKELDSIYNIYDKLYKLFEITTIIDDNN